MKAHLFLAVVLVILRVGSLEGVAQGQFVFNNNNATKITNGLTGMAADKTTKVAMYYSTNLNALTDSSLPLVLNTNAITNVLTNLLAAGVFAGNTRTVPGVRGSNYIVVEIRAWTGGLPDWDSARAAYECNYTNFPNFSNLPQVGQSRRFTLYLTEPPDPAPLLVSAGLNAILLNSCSDCGSFSCYGPAPLLHLSVVPGSQPYRVRISGPRFFPGIYFRLQSSATLASNSWQTLTSITPSSFAAWTNEWTDPQGTNGPLFYRVTSEY